MKVYEYKKIDAFTSGESLGNPAACIYLKEGQSLSEADMLHIAKRHKGFISEVVYCRTKPDRSFELTYYSSECEVDFCGHGTVACMYDLIKGNPALLEKKEITIYAGKKGVLTVYNEIETQDAVYISAPKPRHIGTELSIDEVSEALSLQKNQISNSYPVDVIDAGLKTLIVPMTALKDEISIFPDEQILKTFCLNQQIDITLIFSLETENPQNKARTRVFAPKFGYLEDPATGSGNSAFGYYMLKNKVWDGSPITIEQGGADRIYNTVKLVYMNDCIRFGGKAATRIEGVYHH